MAVTAALRKQGYLSCFQNFPGTILYISKCHFTAAEAKLQISTVKYLNICKVAVLIYWEMDGFISFASEVGKEKNSGLQRSIQIFILLPLKAW